MNATSFDWSATKRQLADALARADAALDPSDADRRRILDARALTLAGATLAAAPEPGTDILIFRLGPARYGIDVAFVRDVAPAATPTPVPGAPAAIAGVLNLRGEVVAAAELAGLLGLPRPDAPRRLLFVVSAADGPLAVLVDQAEAVVSLPARRVLPPAAPHPLVAGVTDDGLVLLSAEALLASAAIRVS